MPITVNSTVNTSPFFPDGKSPGARCTAPTEESGNVFAQKRAASSASRSYQRQIVFFACFAISFLLCVERPEVQALVVRGSADISASRGIKKFASFESLFRIECWEYSVHIYWMSTKKASGTPVSGLSQRAASSTAQDRSKA